MRVVKISEIKHYPNTDLSIGRNITITSDGYFKGGGELTRILRECCEWLRVVHIVKVPTTFDVSGMKFPKLRHIVVDSLWVDPLPLLKLCMCKLQTLHSPFQISRGIYSRCWEVTGNLPDIAVFPMLLRCEGFNLETYIPNVLMNEKIVYGHGHEIAYHCLTNGHKLRAITTLVLCLKWIKCKDLIPKITKYAMSLSRDEWKQLLWNGEGVVLTPEETVKYQKTLKVSF